MLYYIAYYFFFQETYKVAVELESIWQLKKKGKTPQKSLHNVLQKL